MAEPWLGVRKHHTVRVLVSQGHYSMVNIVSVLFIALKIISISLYAFIFNCVAVLHGPGLLCDRCVFENCAGTVTLIPQDGAQCSVNGSVVTEPCQLTQGKHSAKPICSWLFFNELGLGVFGGEAKKFCTNKDFVLRCTIMTLVWANNAFIHFECSDMRPHLQMKCADFVSPAPLWQHTQGMSGLWTQLSTGQMPFLLLNILKGERPRTKLQTKPQALHLIGRWSW